MGIIKILDESLSNMIAAGEVVENPASLIKELLENSLDADSKYIRIDVKNGGKNIKFTDDGKGMSREDLLLCIERHATSKISSKDDLFNLTTYGFRGEALSSIAAVSKMIIATKRKDDSLGYCINVSAEKITNLKEIQKGFGTEIEIKDLFFNTPARLKFLRKDATENTKIKEVILQEALANPEVSIVLTIDGGIRPVNIRPRRVVELAHFCTQRNKVGQGARVAIGLIAEVCMCSHHDVCQREN